MRQQTRLATLQPDKLSSTCSRYRTNYQRSVIPPRDTAELALTFLMDKWEKGTKCKMDNATRNISELWLFHQDFSNLFLEKACIRYCQKTLTPLMLLNQDVDIKVRPYQAPSVLKCLIRCFLRTPSPPLNCLNACTSESHMPGLEDSYFIVVKKDLSET